MDDKIAKELIASNLLIAKYLREILRQEKDDPKTATEAKERINRIMDDFNAMIKVASD